MFTVDDNFPIELAELAFDWLKDSITITEYNPLAWRLNESTNKSIIYALLVKISNYMARRHNDVKLIPALEEDSPLIWMFSPTEKISGRVDISVFERNLSNDVNKRNYFFVFVIKAESLDESVHQCLIYLKRIREINVNDHVGNFELIIL